MKWGLAILWFLPWGLCALGAPASPAENPHPLPPASLPDLGLSLLRLVGALALVLALFLGGSWLFRNWQRLLTRQAQSPKLRILEVKPLGQRHALYVIGYEEERLLLAASPAGVNLLTRLPSGSTTETTPPNAPRGFGEVLRSLTSSPAP